MNELTGKLLVHGQGLVVAGAQSRALVPFSLVQCSLHYTVDGKGSCHFAHCCIFT